MPWNFSGKPPKDTWHDERVCDCRQSPGKGGLPASMETLEHHWDGLPDSRKQTLAQMAVLTRWMSFPEALQHRLPVCWHMPLQPCISNSLAEQGKNLVQGIHGGRKRLRSASAEGGGISVGALLVQQPHHL